MGVVVFWAGWSTVASDEDVGAESWMRSGPCWPPGSA